jgi:hypothetical protein
MVSIFSNASGPEAEQQLKSLAGNEFVELFQAQTYSGEPRRKFHPHTTFFVAKSRLQRAKSPPCFVGLPDFDISAAVLCDNHVLYETALLETILIKCGPTIAMVRSGYE